MISLSTIPGAATARPDPELLQFLWQKFITLNVFLTWRIANDRPARVVWGPCRTWNPKSPSARVRKLGTRLRKAAPVEPLFGHRSKDHLANRRRTLCLKIWTLGLKFPLSNLFINVLLV